MIGRSVVFCVVFMGAASASVIDSPTVMYTLTTGSGPAPVGTFDGSLGQFNPALGTLTGISVFLNGDVNMNLHAEIAGAGATSISATFSEGMFLNSLPGVPEFDTFLEFEQPNFGCTGTGSDEFTSCSVDHDFDSGGSSTMGSPLAPTPNLNAYIGLGTVPFQLGNFTSITGITSTPTLTDYSSNLLFNNTQITGNIYLEYTYTPATSSTPEPASTALIGAGLTLFGLMRYRKAFQTRTMAPARNPRSA
jgi:hypothetical protein